MKNKKITIIGAGNVGSTCALWTAAKKLGDVVLVDIVESVKGKALDILQATPLLDADCKVIGTMNYEDTKDSDVIVITAGIPRKEGMSRDDLVKTNANIVKSVTEQAVKHSPNAVIVVVSNPLDAMAYVAYKASRFPSKRIIGMAGVLDSARFRAFISQEMNVPVTDVEAMVMGSHGDTMIPMERLAKINGKSVIELIPKEKLEKIIQRTRNGGAEFLPLLKTSAWVTPGIAAAEMIEAIIKDTGKILPCSAYLQGEYGVNDLFIGVPVKLGKSGAEEIVEIDMNEEEKNQFNKAVKHISEIVDIAKKNI